MLSESGFKHEDSRTKVMGKIKNISLKVIDGDVVYNEHQIGSLRVATLQMLFLEKLYAQEARYENINVDTIAGKKLRSNE